MDGSPPTPICTLLKKGARFHKRKRLSALSDNSEKEVHRKERKYIDNERFLIPSLAALP